MDVVPPNDGIAVNPANSRHLTDPEVVYGHRVCITREVKWLCLDKIYQKIHRPNTYDIGGTYMLRDVADYWFTFRTEQVGNISLLHLFICNHGEGSFSVAVSSGNRINLDKKSDIAYLPHHLKNFNFKSLKEFAHSYLTTYSFSEFDVESLQDKNLYIAISFPLSNTDVISLDVINEIKMNHDCSALLTDPIGSDFVMESADDTKFNVHKVILASQSDVFKAMLKEETAESQTGHVKLDIDEEDLRYMLEFIYSGTVKEANNANFLNLLVLADQYNIKGLFELSEVALAEQLDLNNALDILVLADMHDSEYLKMEALKFIKMNKDVLKSNVFKEIKNLDLMRQLCIYLSS